MPKKISLVVAVAENGVIGKDVECNVLCHQITDSTGHLNASNYL